MSEKNEIKELFFKLIGKDPLLNILTFEWGMVKLYDTPLNSFDVAYLVMDKEYTKNRTKNKLLAKSEKRNLIEIFEDLFSDSLIFEYDFNKFFVFAKEDKKEEIEVLEDNIKVGATRIREGDSAMGIVLKCLDALTDGIKVDKKINYL